MKTLLIASAFLVTPVDITPDRSLICLAETIFYEARGEEEKGQFAVAEVVMNRVSSKRFPNTVCGVVNQPSRNPKRPLACAFSYVCDKKPRRILRNEIYTWDRAVQIAHLFITGPPPSNHTKGSLHYIRCDLKHRVIWSKRLKQKVKISNHCFLE